MAEGKQTDTNTLFFTQLVMSFQAAALQSLGKVPNTLSGKNEINLQVAKNSIDILGMLEEKTSGNLTEDELKMLRQSLSQLRMLYVEVMNNNRPGGSASDT